MSHYYRGCDAAGVIHYVYDNQGVCGTFDPWCRRETNPQSYGTHVDVEWVDFRTPVTCIQCLWLRQKR